jgi:putative addiction module component (TIGR02574 family)
MWFSGNGIIEAAEIDSEKSEASMSVADDLVAQALTLPPEERAEIAHQLLESLPDEDDLPVIVDEELAAEINRRIENRRLGRAKLVDLETFKKTLREASNGSKSS